MKEPESETKQLVIPGVPIKTVRAYKREAFEKDCSLAEVLREALKRAIKAGKGGGGNRTRSQLTELAAA
jgi:hypothetical protein